MSEFHDDYPQYELMAQHSEEEGKAKRKQLWTVFWIMLTITIVELILGSYANKWGLLSPDRTSSIKLKIIFIALTVGKAYFIVFSFMHMGHEKKVMKYSVLVPYLLFVSYLIYIVLAEAVYCGENKNKMDDLIVKQKIELNAAAASGQKGEGAIHEESKKNEGAKDQH